MRTWVLILFVTSSLFAETLTPKQWKVKAAQADVEYFEHRLRTVETVLEKTRVQHRFDERKYQRLLNLKKNKAISDNEFEDAEVRYEQSRINIQMMESRLAEARSEIDIAKARLGLIKTEADDDGTQKVTRPAGEGHVPRRRRASWRSDHELLQYLLEWRLLGFDLPQR